MESTDEEGEEESKGGGGGAAGVPGKMAAEKIHGAQTVLPGDESETDDDGDIRDSDDDDGGDEGQDSDGGNNNDDPLHHAHDTTTATRGASTDAAPGSAQDGTGWDATAVVSVPKATIDEGAAAAGKGNPLSTPQQKKAPGSVRSAGRSSGKKKKGGKSPMQVNKSPAIGGMGTVL